MKTETEIRTRLSEIDAEIESLSRKQNQSVLDVIQLRDLGTRRKTLLWCLT